MSTMRLAYIKKYPDRHGVMRFYFRRQGYPKVALPPPGSPGFLAAYEAANVKPAAASSTREVRAGRVVYMPGTLGWLIGKFIGSDEFKARAANTQRGDLRVLNRMLTAEINGAPLACGLLRDLKDRQAKQIRNYFREQYTPLAGDQALNMLSVLWQWADETLDLDYIGANPTVGIARLHRSKAENEHMPWTPEVFAAFEAAAPGHLRLCVALCLYTGQRISDVVQMRWSQFDGENITGVVQQKTKARAEIPCHKNLQRILAGLERTDDGRILIGERGDSYSAASPGVMIRRIFKSLGISGYSIHGLRKNAAQAMSEAGAPENLIQAILGQKSAAMVTHYTKRADQKRRARHAMDIWEADKDAVPVMTLPITLPARPKRRAEG